jgi:hypothetical protein
VGSPTPPTSSTRTTTSYENYDDGSKRMPLLFLQELDRLRSRYDASVSRFAR